MASSKVVREYLAELINAGFENRVPLSVPEEISVKELVDIADRGQMAYPVLCPLLKTVYDASESELIRRRILLSTKRSFLQCKCAMELTKRLEEAGIKHQLLKGSVIRWLYPQPEMREMSDIDLVIYDESLDEAAKVIENMGFKNEGLVKHHMIFGNGNGVTIEAHWCLYDKNVDHSQAIYFNDNFRARLSEGKKYTYEFGREDFYIYMISHMAKHFFETGCGIRNLLDIYVYLKRYDPEMDSDYVKCELKKCGTLDFEKNMRELSFIWLEKKECSGYYEKLFAYMVDSGIYGKNENGIWGQLSKETAEGEENVKLRFYFPSIKFMKEKYTWLKNAPFLLPVAWVVRGASGFFSAESRHHKHKLQTAGNDELQDMLEIYHNLKLDFRK